MRRRLALALLVLAPVVLLSTSASASTIPVGFISYDVLSPGSSAAFDITNMTGPNSTGDSTWPISTTVNLSSLSLTVHFDNGSVVTEPSSYFSLSLDGISWNGSAFGIGGTNPKPTQATLTGSFSPTAILLFDGTTPTINPTFTATVLPSIGTTLANGDFALINATTTGVTPAPEPSSLLLLMTGILGLLVLGHKRIPGSFRVLYSGVGRAAMPLALTIACSVLIPAAHAQKQNVATTPSSGTAGNDVNVLEGSGWPAADTTASNITVTWATTCGGIPVVTNTANSLKHIVGTTERVGVTIPNTLASGTYNVQLSDSAAGDTPFTSINCSLVQVTASSTILASCVPASSLGVKAPVTGPAPVYAIVPNGCWSCSTTGIQVVELETGGMPAVPPASVPTAHVVNSCAGNPATNEAVCVANNTDVYHLDPSNVVTTLTSGSDASTGFSGGSCNNCGVAVNALTNQAVIAMGHSGGSGSALQKLDLATNTFGTPFSLVNQVSENVVVDPIDGVILSLNEFNNYDAISFDNSGNFTTEYGMPISDPNFGEGDSSAVDCKTHIALGPYEFTNDLSLTDVKQAIFTPGTPGSWTAPTSINTIIGSYSAGLSGSAVAHGSSDLGVVTGEFGGSSFAVLKLPSTSGSGTPTLPDYAFVPCITGLSAGLDPHTMTAFVSPNDGKSYGVFASGPPPAELVVADLSGILGRPREGDGHTVIGDGGPGSCLSPGDGVIRSVATH